MQASSAAKGLGDRLWGEQTLIQMVCLHASFVPPLPLALGKIPDKPRPFLFSRQSKKIPSVHTTGPSLSCLRYHPHNIHHLPTPFLATMCETLCNWCVDVLAFLCAHQLLIYTSPPFPSG